MCMVSSPRSLCPEASADTSGSGGQPPATEGVGRDGGRGTAAHGLSELPGPNRLAFSQPTRLLLANERK